MVTFNIYILKHVGNTVPTRLCKQNIHDVPLLNKMFTPI